LVRLGQVRVLTNVRYWRKADIGLIWANDRFCPKADISTRPAESRYEREAPPAARKFRGHYAELARTRMTGLPRPRAATIALITEFRE